MVGEGHPIAGGEVYKRRSRSQEIERTWRQNAGARPSPQLYSVEAALKVTLECRQPNRRQAEEEDPSADLSAAHAYLVPSLLAAALRQAQHADEPRMITLDVIEKAQRFEIRADLPGVLQDNIVLQAEGDVLNLSVKKQDAKQQEGVRVHRQERVSTFAPRSIRLPESCDLSKIEADAENGVLEIIIPKKQASPKQRTIKVGGKGAHA